MRTLGVGSPFSMLALSAIATLGVATLLGLAACSDRASAESESAPLLPEGSKAEPQQVVQRMVGTPDVVAAPKAASSGRDEVGANGGEARASTAGVSGSGDATLPVPESTREPITSKHLELELNRLEAELAN